MIGELLNLGMTFYEKDENNKNIIDVISDTANILQFKHLFDQFMVKHQLDIQHELSPNQIAISSNQQYKIINNNNNGYNHYDYYDRYSGTFRSRSTN